MTPSFFADLLDKGKKPFGDFCLQAIASALPLLALQLIIFPGIASKFGEAALGNIIYLISTIYIFSLTFGSPLNNVRLLYNKKYELAGDKGDFNILVAISCAASALLTVTFLFFTENNKSEFSFLLLTVLPTLMICTDYGSVFFRINLNFKAICINAVFLFMGYLLGYMLLLATSRIFLWPVVYILGQIASLAYIVKLCNFFREPFVFTPLIKRTFCFFCILIITGLLGNVLIYADRLLIAPMLGPELLAVYYCATVIPKMISMFLGPINGVMLSYLAQMGQFSQKYFLILLSTASSLTFILYCVTIFLSKPFLFFFYPQMANQATSLISLTTLAALISGIASVVQPLILRYCDEWILPAMTLLNLFLFLALGIYGVKVGGLIGFCEMILLYSVLMLITKIAIFECGYLRKSK